MATKKQAGHSTRTTKMIGLVPVSVVTSQWRTVRRAPDGRGFQWESAGGVNQRTKAATWRPQEPFAGIRESKGADDPLDIPLDDTQRAASLALNFGELGGYPFGLGHLPLSAARTMLSKMGAWPANDTLNGLADKQEHASKVTRGDGGDAGDAFAGIL